MRIRLPVQGTWVPSLDWGGSPCCAATEPEGHWYGVHSAQLLKAVRSGACASAGTAGPGRCDCWSLCAEACAPTRGGHPCSEKPPFPASKARMEQWRPSMTKNRKLSKINIKKKRVQGNLSTKLKESYRCRKQIVGYQGVRRGGEIGRLRSTHTQHYA